MAKRKYLTDAELEVILQNLSDSEDGLDYSDDDSIMDPDYQPESPNNKENEDVEPIVIENEERSANNNIQKTSKIKSKISYPGVLWKKDNLTLNEAQLNFRGNTELPTDIKELDTPYNVFKFFLTDNILESIVTESNLYAIKKDLNKPLQLTFEELQKYIGIIIYMSLVQLPNVRLYWGEDVGVPIIKNAMTVNRFEKIYTFQ